MNQTLANTTEEDVQEIVSLIQWYQEETDLENSKMLDRVCEDVLAGINWDDDLRAEKINETTFRQLVGLIYAAQPTR